MAARMRPCQPAPDMEASPKPWRSAHRQIFLVAFSTPLHSRHSQPLPTPISLPVVFVNYFPQPCAVPSLVPSDTANQSRLNNSLPVSTPAGFAFARWLMCLETPTTLTVDTLTPSLPNYSSRLEMLSLSVRVSRLKLHCTSKCLLRPVFPFFYPSAHLNAYTALRRVNQNK